MPKVSNGLRNYIREICKLHGCTVKFDRNEGGSSWKKKIFVGTLSSDKDCIDIFCHEFAHYKNFVEGKFPIYHREEDNITIKRMGLRRYAAYTLRAEIYTEKVGRELCKIWFPKHKFVAEYRNTRFWKGYVLGYYSSN